MPQVEQAPQVLQVEQVPRVLLEQLVIQEKQGLLVVQENRVFREPEDKLEKPVLLVLKEPLDLRAKMV